MRTHGSHCVMRPRSSVRGRDVSRHPARRLVCRALVLAILGLSERVSDHPLAVEQRIGLEHGPSIFACVSGVRGMKSVQQSSWDWMDIL